MLQYTRKQKALSFLAGSRKECATSVSLKRGCLSECKKDRANINQAKF